MANKLLAAVVLVVVSMVVLSQQTTYDVHVKIPSPLNEYCIDLSHEIIEICPNDLIDFDTSAIPHVTLYQTDFIDSLLPDLVAAMTTLIPTLRTCSLTMGDPDLSGQYFMWDVVASDCLQNMSNSVVYAAAAYRNKTQAIPSWVLQETDPVTKAKMIYYCEMYGSPNVFDQFVPHITMAWDSVDDMTPLLDLSYPPDVWVPDTVGIGLVGSYGTVLMNDDIGDYTLLPLN